MSTLGAPGDLGLDLRAIEVSTTGENWATVACFVSVAASRADVA